MNIVINETGEIISININVLFDIDRYPEWVQCDLKHIMCIDENNNFLYNKIFFSHYIDILTEMKIIKFNTDYKSFIIYDENFDKYLNFYYKKI